MINKALKALADFANSLLVRLIAIFIVGYIAMTFAADFAYPAFMVNAYNMLAKELAISIENKIPSHTKILRTIGQYNLAWYYLTGEDGKPNPATKVFAPDLKTYNKTSQKVDWQGKFYYDVVVPLKNKQALHIGFYTGPLMSFTERWSWLSTMQATPLGYQVLVLIGLLLFTGIALSLFVSKPLTYLFRACNSLLLARDAYSGVTGGGLDVSGAVTEVKNIAEGLKDIRKQYDEQVAARISREDELRRQRSSYEEEKKTLTKGYHEQLSQTQQKISELYTKEAEEEFINALGREIDVLKSSHQVCQRLLDKLNDKFPTSIVYGAFFKADKQQRFNLEASLGFDDKSVQILRKLDHAKIARTVFGSGKYITVGPETMGEYGFSNFAQDNGLKSIIYLPLIFQSRNLGMLGIYFTTVGQTVHERLRVLRNVVELASRSLYQVIIYEEELEAARTDPLTGLRNKKYFWEIMPQIFDRASANPEQNPISLLMMDGDHFKEINDTYGHQVGDQMLQALAKTIRQCVRVQEEASVTNTPLDYLIRYGGEEFLIVMENTHAKRAVAVAERIRQTIEQKSDWPGAIAKWTVSIGVSTYPGDGKNSDELLLRADTALYYVKEELGRNKVCHASQVPKSFKSAKSAAVIGGDLGIFDPAALLQSLATAQKTGILTVQSRNGKQLWMLFESGRPIQARLGSLAGAMAIIEFVATFEEGNFSFQEKATTGKETMTRLPKLDDSYNVQKSLERCLMDGALAQDNYNAARAVIPTTEIPVQPVTPLEFAARWQALRQAPEPPSTEELNVMSAIAQRLNGSSTLSSIFKELDNTPTNVLWRGAALMLQHGLLQTGQKAETYQTSN